MMRRISKLWVQVLIISLFAIGLVFILFKYHSRHGVDSENTRGAQRTSPKPRVPLRVIEREEVISSPTLSIVIVADSVSTTVTLPQGFASIEGRVFDDAFQGVSGAEVKALVLRGEQCELQQLTKSDEAGTYLLSALTSGTYTLSVSHPLFAPATRTNIFLYPEQELTGIDFSMSPGVVLPGEVVDQQGKAVPQAEIKLSRQLTLLLAEGTLLNTLNPVQETESDDQGKFQLPRVGSGSYHLDCRKTGYAPRFLELSIHEEKPPAALRLVLYTQGEIQGRVLANNQPVKDARVEAPRYYTTDENSVALAPPIVTISDADGRFQLQGLQPEGAYDLTVEAPGFTAHQFTHILSGTTGVELVLTQGGDITGAVLLLDSGKPVAHVKVSAMNPELDFEAHTFSQADGSYAFGRLPPGTFDLWIETIHFAFFPQLGVQVQNAQVTSGVDFLLYEPLEIRGKVIDTKTNQGIGEAQVSAGLLMGTRTFEHQAFKGVTDADGSFSLRLLPEGIYTVTATAKGYSPARFPKQQQKLSLTRMDSPLEVSLYLTGCGSVQGRVRNERGKLLAFTLVRLENERGNLKRASKEKFDTRTNEQGVYELSEIPLSSPQQLFLLCRAEGYAPGKSSTFVLTSRRPFAKVDLVLEEGQQISGVVKDEQGGAIDRAQVRLSNLSYPGLAGLKDFETETDGNGRFHFFRIPAGKIRIAVNHPSYVVGRGDFTVKKGTDLTDIEIVLSSAISIVGTVKDDLGTPLSQARIAASAPSLGTLSSTQSSHEGNFVLSGLKPAEYRLSVRYSRSSSRGKRNYQFTFKEIVAPATGVVLTLPINGEVRGRVLDVDSLSPLEKFSLSGSGQVKSAAYDSRFNLGSLQFQGSKGYFEIEGLPSGDYTLHGSAPEYLSENKKFSLASPGAQQIGDFMLSKGGRIEGSVYSLVSEEPVVAATLKLSETGQSSRSGKDGSFRFVGVKPGDYQLTVTHGNYQSQQLEHVVVEKDETTQLQPIYLTPAAAVEGFVYDHKGEALHNILLHNLHGESERQTRTSLDGYYYLSGLPVGVHVIEAREERSDGELRQQQEIVLNVEETKNLDFVFDHSQVLRGKIFSGDYEVKNLEIFVYDFKKNLALSGTFAPNKFFRFSDLPRGEILLVAAAEVKNPPEGSAQEIIKSFSRVLLAQSPTTHYLSFEDAQVQGWIGTPDGSPCGGLEVFLIFLGPLAEAKALRLDSKTQPDGTFLFYGLPEGNYDLYVSLSAKKVKRLATFYLNYYQRMEGVKFVLKEE